MRILVVDDDRAVRESLRRSLSFNGYTVDLASDGQEALEHVVASRPDAMVLDVKTGAGALMTTLEASRELAEGIPDASLCLFPRYGHGVYEETESFHRLVREFFQ